jgi:adenosylhomocysteine nucleosidase
MEKNRLIGIIGAMPEEVDGIVHLLQEREEFTQGMRIYYKGKLNSIPTIVVFSRWGKVAAATTVTALITEFKITELIFTGVAGAIHKDLRVGDIVIGNRFIQHDMDARPIMKKHEIPLLGKTYLDSDDYQVNLALKAIQEVLSSNKLQNAIGTDVLSEFGITKPRVVVGEIASGDKFFSDAVDKQTLLQELPDTLCVEMEGAAVAQVCFEYEIPFTIIRTISDAADDSAHIDFTKFLSKISSKYSIEIIKSLYNTFEKNL